MEKQRSGDADALASSIENLLKLGTISDLRIVAGGPVEFKVSIAHSALEGESVALRRTLAAISDQLM